MRLPARLAFFAGAIALLSGCSAREGVAPATATLQTTSQSDLVYLATGEETGVEVYTYPDGKQVERLTGLNDAVAVCSDSSGNVWVIDSESRSRSTLFKYTHGGSTPIATLHIRESADACSVDPSTGNLAVATLNSNVAIWQQGQGSPALFSTSAFFKKTRTITYDGSGNLYMRSFTTGESAAWLPAGKTAVAKFHINRFGAYGWDGRYFVVGSPNGGNGKMTRYKLHDGRGEVVGTISAKICGYSYVPPSFAINGSALAISCGLLETNSLNYYTYPKGGKPTKTLDPGNSGSVAIST